MIRKNLYKEYTKPPKVLNLQSFRSDENPTTISLEILYRLVLSILIPAEGGIKPTSCEDPGDTKEKPASKPNRMALLTLRFPSAH